MFRPDSRTVFHRRPAALQTLPSAASLGLSRLCGIEGFSRAVLVGVVPLVALEVLGTKERVAQMYLAAAVLTLTVTLNFATLERLLRRRRVVELAALFVVLAAGLLAWGAPVVLPLGIGLRSAASSLFTVCLSLYIMDFIGKRDLPRAESRRVQYVGFAWVLGPWLGGWLVSHGHLMLPFALSAMAGLGALAWFRRLRYGDDEVLVPARSRAANPIDAVVRYWRRRPLRVAYGIVFSRSCFWVALFVYGPIYTVEAGLPPWVAGTLLSGVSVLLFFSPLVRRLAERLGTRQVIVTGLVVTGASTVMLGVLGEARPLGLLFWVSGAVGGVLLDVLGNIPFMRLVRPRERVAMTSVFSTWREGSELVTPLVVTLVLLAALPFGTFYAVLGVLHFLAALATLRLPRRL